MNSESLACRWFELPDILDPPGTPAEHCTSGKPATFWNCSFSRPVCEDHRCRCVQGMIERHESLPARSTDSVAELFALLSDAGAVCTLHGKPATLSELRSYAEQSLAARLVPRCNISGNPCGTDTWGNGCTCHCTSCQDWLRAQEKLRD